MNEIKIDKNVAAMKLIEILLAKGMINQATYTNIVLPSNLVCHLFFLYDEPQEQRSLFTHISLESRLLCVVFSADTNAGFILFSRIACALSQIS